MTDPDYRALCAELVDELEHTEGWPTRDALLVRAHAALAQPVPMPSDAELRAALLAGIDSFPPQHPEAKHLSADEYSVELEIRKARSVWNLSRRGIPTNNASQEDHE